MKGVLSPQPDYKPTVRALVLAALPGVVSLVLYYSLALHMWLALGRWPTNIGERGFPPHLVSHVHLEHYYFGALIGFGIFVWPLALLICGVVARWERYVIPLTLFALFFLVSCLLRTYAPAEFQTWWMD